MKTFTGESVKSPAAIAASLLPLAKSLATPAAAENAVKALRFVAASARRHPAQAAIGAFGLILVARKLLRERRDTTRLLLR